MLAATAMVSATMFATAALPASATGVYLVVCELHAGMQGAVVVVPASESIPTQAQQTAAGASELSRDLLALASTIATTVVPPYDGTAQDSSGILFPFSTYTLTFPRAGTYPYRCLLHDELGMLGTVTVASPGYHLVGKDGGVFNFGGSGSYGSLGGAKLNAPIVGMASSPTGHGYWLVAADGGVFAYGDAGFSGSLGGTKLNAPIVGISA